MRKLFHLCKKLLSMKRLFAAIPIHLSEGILRSIASMQYALEGERIRWIPSENMHLTLKFFGNTPAKKITAMSEALSKATKDFPDFPLEIDRVGLFGSQHNPRVIWMGFGEEGPLYQLKKQITQELEKTGIYEDRQNFVPHLTIARIKKLGDKRFFQKVIDKHKNRFHQETKANELVLYESILKSTGAVYKEINRFPFKKNSNAR